MYNNYTRPLPSWSQMLHSVAGTNFKKWTLYLSAFFCFALAALPVQAQDGLACPVEGARKKIASSFHSTIIIDYNDSVKYWGQGQELDGTNNVLSPLVLSKTRYNGKPLAVAGGSVGITGRNHQLFLLTDVALYGWGHANSGTIPNSGDFSSIPFPSGVTAGQVNFIDAAGGGIALVLNDGTVYIRNGGNTGGAAPSIYGDGSTGSTMNSTWRQVRTSASGNPVLTGVVRLAMSQKAVIALTSTGKVYVWGNLVYAGNLSSATSPNYATEITLLPPGVTPMDVNIISKSGSVNSAQFILGTNGKVYAMGNGGWGALGAGNTNNVTGGWSTVKMNASTELTDVIQISSNKAYAYTGHAIGALKSSGQLYLWGSNERGMLGGSPDDVATYNYARIPPNFNVNQAKVSYFHMGGHTTVAFLQGSNRFCYIGHLVHGSMGDGNTSNSQDLVRTEYDCINTPDEFLCKPKAPEGCAEPSGNDLIASSSNATLVINGQPSVTYWGRGSSSAQGGISVGKPVILYEYNGLARGVAASAAGNSTSAQSNQMWILTTEGLWGWGYSANTIDPSVIGALGLNHVDLPTGVTASQVGFIRSSGGGIALVTNSGEVYIKGGNGSAVSARAYGDGTASTKNSAWHQVKTNASTNLTGVRDLSFTGTAVMAVAASGVYTWGNNVFLGNSAAMANQTYANAMILPTGMSADQVKSVEIIQSGSDGAAHFILGFDGQVYSLGQSRDGVLGLGNGNTITAWERITTLAGVRKISSNNSFPDGRYSIGALTLNGMVYVWGGNPNGMLGMAASVASLNVPTLVTTGGGANVPSGTTDITGGNAAGFEMGGRQTIIFSKNNNNIYFAGDKRGGAMADDVTSETSANITSFTQGGTEVANCAGVVYNISGHLINDTDPFDDGDIEGDGINTMESTVYYANLLDEAGYVLATSAINSSTGAYSFNGFPSGNYVIQVSQQQGTLFSKLSAVTVPANWNFVGAQLGTTSGQGIYTVANGSLPIALTSTVTNANIGVRLIQADLSLVKSVDKSTPLVGEDVTFTVTVSNKGPNTANNVVVKDQLPAGYTLVSVDPAADYDATTGIWTLAAPIPAGNSASLLITATVGITGPYKNVAEVIASDEPDPNSPPDNNEPDEDDQDDETPVPVPVADLSLSKEVDNATPEVGSDVVFTVKVSNAGPNTATGVVVKDQLPSGYTFVSAVPSADYNALTGTWTLANAIANGGSTELTITATVNASGDYTNTAEVAAANEHDPDSEINNNIPTEDDQDSVTPVPVPVADLSLSKVVDNAAPEVGDDVVFTVKVSNAGPSAATGVVVEDKLPSGYTFVSAVPSADYDALTGIWTLSNSIASGGSAELTITATVKVSGDYTNTAEVVAANEHDPDSEPGNNEPLEDDQDSVTPVASSIADLSLSKIVDNATPDAGSEVTFTVTVSNAGPSAATGVVVEDKLPSGYTFVSAVPAADYDAVTGIWTLANAIANGSSAVLTITARVNAGGVYMNTAEVVAANETDPDSEPGNNEPLEDDQDSETTVPVPVADLSLSKVADNTTPEVGSDVVFTVTVNNAGPSVATGVVVEDKLPSGYTFVSAVPAADYDAVTGIWTLANAIDSGSSAALVITATVNASGVYKNIAEVVAANEPDPNSPPDNNEPGEDDQDEETPVPTPVADLSLSKVVDNATPEVGSEVVFTVTVNNAGPSAATGVVVEDKLPSGYTFVSAVPAADYDAVTGIWTLANAIDSGSSAALVITATVNASGVYKNIAEVVAANEPDPNSPPDNNEPGEDDQDEETPVPTPVADLSLSKVADNTTPEVGSEVVFTVTVNNAGPSAATGVVVEDKLPSGYAFVSAVPAADYDEVTGIWTLANAIDSGSSAALVITATVNASGVYKNIAEVVAANEPDPNSPPDNNEPGEDDQDEETPVPTPVADLSLSKVVDNATPDVGSNVVFTVTVNNAGPSAATGVVVKDQLPTGYTFVSAVPAVDYDALTGTWTLANAIASGGSAALQITATVNANGNYTNTAEVAAVTEKDPDSEPDNNIPSEDDQDSATPVPVPVADLSLSKVVDNATPDVSSNVVFTVTVNNAGPSAATGVVVEDKLPSGYTFVSAAPAADYDALTGTWTLANAIDSGSSAVLTITATVNASGDYTNTAEVVAVTEKDPDSAPDNNIPSEDDQDSETPVPVPVADLKMVKSGPARADAGQEISYTLVITNDGPSDVIGAVVKDATVANFTATGVNCSGVTGTADCPSAALNLTDLNAGTLTLDIPAQSSVTLTVTGTAGLSSRVIDNIARVDPPTGVKDPTPGNNEDDAETQINAALAGKVFNDLNALKDGTVNGAGTNAGSTLYAHLVDGTTVIATVTVGNDGTFQFPAVIPGNYTVVVDTSSTTVGNALPPNWVYTGEKLGAGSGSDGTVNGTLAFTVGNVNIDSLKFGIQQLPLAHSDILPEQVNPGGNTLVNIPADAFGGNDYDGGVIDSLHIVRFPEGADRIQIGTEVYTVGNWPAKGITVPANAVGEPAIPVQVDPEDGAVDVVITYNTIDNGGGVSPAPGVLTIPFYSIKVAGNVFNDGNGMRDGYVNGPGTDGNGLKVALLNESTGLIERIVLLGADGRYSFDNLNKGNYTVMITNGPAIKVGGPIPPVVLQTGWVSTGEQVGTGIGNDGLVDGKIYLGEVVTDQLELNFGIERLPEAKDIPVEFYHNPGGNVTVAVTPLKATDPEDGNIGQGGTFIITTLPENGTLYYDGVAVKAGDTIPDYMPQLLEVDPIDGSVTVTFTYSVIDSAGLADPTPATLKMHFGVIGLGGYVYHDANGLSDHTVNGTGEGRPSGIPLYANLVDPVADTVMESVLVDAEGFYFFPIVAPYANVMLQISTLQGVPGQPSTQVTLPEGWVYTGEHLGLGAGNDGLVDGMQLIFTGWDTLRYVNFGIERTPTADDKFIDLGIITTNVPFTLGTQPLSGSDPEDGTYGPGDQFIFGEQPACCAYITYNGVLLNPGTVIDNYDPVKLAVVYTQLSNDVLNFSYTVRDQAGQSGKPGTYSFVGGYRVPVNLSGNVLLDANGLTDNTVNGPGEGLPSDQPLYANLIDSLSNTVVGSVLVDIDGNYLFSSVQSYTYFKVQISTVKGVTGNPAPATVLPGGWVNTGEHIGTGAGHDGSPDGMQSVYATADLQEINFGIERTPTADNKLNNLGTVTVNVAYPLTAQPLSGSDPEDGSYGAGSDRFVFGTQPECCAVVSYNGVVLQPGMTITGYNPALLTVVYTSIPGTSLSFTYKVKDAAGKESAPAVYTLTAGSDQPLPVKWAHFSVKANGARTELNWSTGQELNNAGFEIERSLDGSHFDKIEYVASQAEQGNSTTQLDYLAFDEQPAAGINYYRLKQIDKDGHVNFSEVRQLAFNIKVQELTSIYPNPATERVFVKTDWTQMKQVRLLDIKGRLVFHSEVKINEGIDMSGLAHGAYMLQVEHTDGSVSNFKVVKQ